MNAEKKKRGPIAKCENVEKALYKKVQERCEKEGSNEKVKSRGRPRMTCAELTIKYNNKLKEKCFDKKNTKNGKCGVTIQNKKSDLLRCVSVPAKNKPNHGSKQST